MPSQTFTTSVLPSQWESFIRASAAGSPEKKVWGWQGVEVILVAGHAGARRDGTERGLVSEGGNRRQAGEWCSL
jgi:hypothetical protein